MNFLTAISPFDSEGVKFAKLQRKLRAIADAAGISYNLGGYLSDISPGGDTEGVKWAKLGAWAKEIADNISGGGGGGRVTAQDSSAAPISVASDTTVDLATLILGVGKWLVKADATIATAPTFASASDGVFLWVGEGAADNVIGPSQLEGWVYSKNPTAPEFMDNPHTGEYLVNVASGTVTLHCAIYISSIAAPVNVSGTLTATPVN